MLALLSLITITYLLLSLINYKWEFGRLTKFLLFIEDNRIIFGSLIKGLFLTIEISLLSIFLAIIIGSLTAIGQLSHFYSIKLLCKFYITTIRNTPLMIQILINYFLIGHTFNIDGYWMAVITLALFEGSYISEIIRGSILSIDKQQWLTGYSLGMNRFQVLIKVILPQSYPIILPAMGNILVSTVKDSSLLSIISIYEMTFEAQKAVSETFMTFEVWFTVAFLYFSINIVIVMLTNIVEKRLSRWKI